MHTTVSDDPRAPKFQAKREFLFAALGALTGLILLPVLVYFSGRMLLGSYGTGAGNVLEFYGDFWRDLLSGVLTTWLLALLPYVALSALRWLLPSRKSPSEIGTPPKARPDITEKRRKEPTLS